MPTTGRTLTIGLNPDRKSIRQEPSGGHQGNVDAAKAVGQGGGRGWRGRRTSNEVVFNRNGFLYHGRVKALADAAREAGLQVLESGPCRNTQTPDQCRTTTSSQDRVVHINRVAKVVKGGRRFSFSALVVVGDGDGVVGTGYGKAGEVPEAIRKGVDKRPQGPAPGHPWSRDPAPRGPRAHFGAGPVSCLRPASPGTGVIAGGPVRAVLEAAGVCARRSDQDHRHEQSPQRRARDHDRAGRAARSAGPRKSQLGQPRHERNQASGSKRQSARVSWVKQRDRVRPAPARHLARTGAQASPPDRRSWTTRPRSAGMIDKVKHLVRWRNSV